MSVAALLLVLVQEIPSTRWEQPVHTPAAITSFEREGKTWYTIRANNSSARNVLREVGRLSHRAVRGMSLLERSSALVTVELEARPLEQVLEYTLGSLGFAYSLTDTAIEIVDGTAIDAATRLDLANAAWIKASMRFPEHPSAPRARMSLGEIAERRGLLNAARSHYLTLIQDYPLAELTGEAYMRSGRLSARLGQWAEAARLFRTLASLESAPEFHAPARLEWARAMIAQGDPQSALYMLSALDANYPAEDVSQSTARRLVRARALNARELYMEALQELDRADASFDELATWEALVIRAEALEGIGMPGEAAQAWLLYATRAEEPERSFAYTESARLALEAEDELAVLFVVRQASDDGVDYGLERFEQEARRRLGLAESDEPDLAKRVDRIEELLDEGDFARARERLEPLYLAANALGEALAARVSLAWARCVEDADGLETAMALLDEVRRGLDDPEARRVLDVGAAHMLETAGRFEDAIEAYQGRYVKP